MNGQYNEEMAWRRLQDVQREAENARLVESGGPAVRGWLSMLALRAWLVAGLAARRPPRWHPAVLDSTRKEGGASGANAA